eukprot:Hpha_TRINITY_DN19368_c0_g1::TRINITY_DN19368_c0_g1_i1::g.81231::m.81231
MSVHEAKGRVKKMRERVYNDPCARLLLLTRDTVAKTDSSIIDLADYTGKLLQVLDEKELEAKKRVHGAPAARAVVKKYEADFNVYEPVRIRRSVELAIKGIDKDVIAREPGKCTQCYSCRIAYSCIRPPEYDHARHLDPSGWENERYKICKDRCKSFKELLLAVQQLDPDGPDDSVLLDGAEGDASLHARVANIITQRADALSEMARRIGVLREQSQHYETMRGQFPDAVKMIDLLEQEERELQKLLDKRVLLFVRIPSVANDPLPVEIPYVYASEPGWRVELNSLLLSHCSEATLAQLKVHFGGHEINDTQSMPDLGVGMQSTLELV